MTYEELKGKMQNTGKRFLIFQLFCGLIFINIFSIAYTTGDRFYDTYLHEKEGWVRIPALLKSVEKDYQTVTTRLTRRAGKQNLFPNGSRRISGYKYSYKYSYNGEAYNGSSFSRGSSLHLLQEATPDKVGEATLVWVKPNDPSKSFFDFPARLPHFFLSILITGFFMYLFYLWKKWIETRHPELSFRARTDFFSKKKNGANKDQRM